MKPPTGMMCWGKLSVEKKRPRHASIEKNIRIHVQCGEQLPFISMNTCVCIYIYWEREGESVCVFSASRYFILIGHHRFRIEYDIASLTGVGEHDGNLFPEFVLFLSRAEPPMVAGSSLSNHVDIRFFHSWCAVVKFALRPLRQKHEEEKWWEMDLLPGCVLELEKSRNIKRNMIRCKNM